MSSLECCICFRTISDPGQLPCSHWFCRPCLAQWAAYDPERTCPVCRTPMPRDLSEVSAPPALGRMLEAFEAALHKPLGLPEGSVTVGDEVLSQGIFATVFAGRFRGRRVAVKELIVSTPRQAELVINEVAMAGLVRADPHPNLVTIHGTIRDAHRCACPGVPVCGRGARGRGL